MSGSKKPRKSGTYSWDTSVILGWFKQENDKPLEDIALVIDEIERSQAKLIMSVTVYCEVLACGDSVVAATTFRSFLKRSNVLLANVDPRVAEKTVEIREYTKTHGDLKSIKTPDAQIAATATIHGADVLHTFDPALLRLNGHDIVNGLVVTWPKPLSGHRSVLPHGDQS